MPGAAPFSWQDSPGWLVLSGSADPLSEIRARALSRYSASGAIAHISLAADSGDAIMDDMAELGAPTGYLVDLEELDNNTIYERLSQAAMIVLEAGPAPLELLRLLRTTAIHALKAALRRGALLFFEGAAAAIAGQHVLLPDGEIASGLNFVSGALVHCGGAPAGPLPPGAVGIRLAPGAALALGPAGQVETWGEPAITLRLPRSEPGAAQYAKQRAIE